MFNSVFFFRKNLFRTNEIWIFYYAAGLQSSGRLCNWNTQASAGITSAAESSGFTWLVMHLNISTFYAKKEVRGEVPSFKIKSQYLQRHNMPKWMYWSEPGALTAAVNRYKSGVELKRRSIRMMEGCGMSVGEAATPHASTVLRGRRAQAGRDWWGRRGSRSSTLIAFCFSSFSLHHSVRRLSPPLFHIFPEFH